MSNLIEIKYKLPTVSFSKEELKKYVAEEITKIKNDASLDLAAARNAANALIKTFNEQRLEITRKWDQTKKTFIEDVTEALKPALDFEEQLAEEIKEQEEQRKVDKQAAIEALEGYEKFKTYFQDNKKWLNKGTTIKTIKEEIAKGIETVDAEMETIKSSCKLCELEPEKYLALHKTLTLAGVLERINDDHHVVQETKKREAEAAKKREEAAAEAAALAEAQKAAKEEAAAEPEPAAKEEPEPAPEAPLEASEPKEAETPASAKIITVCRYLTGTVAQLNELSERANEIGVKITKEGE